MKKYLLILFSFMLVTGIFTSCSEKSDKPDETGNSSTSMTFETYKAVTSHMRQDADDKTLYYESDSGESVKIQILDNKGNLKYTEESLYSSDGSIIGYNYYDNKNNPVARYIIHGDNQGYYYYDGTPMSESEFAKRMDLLQNGK